MEAVKMFNMIIHDICIQPIQKEIPFPKVMEFIGFELYVFFHDYGKGTVIRKCEKYSSYEIGEYRDDWVMYYFKDCQGVWTIEQ